MDKIDIARLKELAEKATPGPWEVRNPINNSYWITAKGLDDYGTCVRRDIALAVKDTDYAFIAATSPDVVLALIEGIEESEREIAYLRMDREAQRRKILRLEKEADWRKRKEGAEIRRIKAAAEKDEFALAVQKGRYVPKEQVHLELAARAVTLASGLKAAFEAAALDLIALVEGNPKKAAALYAFLEERLDSALNEYSAEMAFEVQFVDAETQPGDK